ncbi:MAG: hypothetical protein HQ481_20695 [Alphaproteobacteria bacterium]|nr:hypothetical protein [Alphaproteobacteria bacterium]
MPQNSTAPSIPHLHGRRLTIRADAGPTIGTGHVMRCLALAEGWREAGGAVTLASRDLPGGLITRAENLGVTLEPAGDDSDGAWAEGADLAVIDGWAFTAGHLAAAKARAPLLVIDDTAERSSIPADLLLNPNVYAEAGAYVGRTEGRLLIGPAFALLRGEFTEPPPERAYPPVARHLLLLLGGADPIGASTAALAAARAARATEPGIQRITLVVGAANPARAQLTTQTADDPAADDPAVDDPAIVVRYDVTAMAPLMDTADLVVSAGGSTVLELAARGVPMLLGALIAEEEPVITTMQALGAARALGRFDSFDATRMSDAILALARDRAARRALSEVARTIVDGRGVERVIAACVETPP